MRKRTLVVSGIIALLATAVIGSLLLFTSCNGDLYGKARLSFSTSSVYITLDAEAKLGLTATSTTVPYRDVVVTAKGMPGGIGSEVIVKSESESIATASVIAVNGKKSTVRIVAQTSGKTRIRVMSAGGGVVAYINVTVDIPARDVTLKPDMNFAINIPKSGDTSSVEFSQDCFNFYSVPHDSPVNAAYSSTLNNMSFAIDRSDGKNVGIDEKSINLKDLTGGKLTLIGDPGVKIVDMLATLTTNKSMTPLSFKVYVFNPFSVQIKDTSGALISDGSAVGCDYFVSLVLNQNSSSPKYENYKDCCLAVDNGNQIVPAIPQISYGFDVDFNLYNARQYVSVQYIDYNSNNTPSRPNFTLRASGVQTGDITKQSDIILSVVVYPISADGLRFDQSQNSNVWTQKEIYVDVRNVFQQSNQLYVNGNVDTPLTILYKPLPVITDYTDFNLKFESGDTDVQINNTKCNQCNANVYFLVKDSNNNTVVDANNFTNYFKVRYRNIDIDTDLLKSNGNGLQYDGLFSMILTSNSTTKDKDNNTVDVPGGESLLGKIGYTLRVMSVTEGFEIGKIALNLYRQVDSGSILFKTRDASGNVVSTDGIYPVVGAGSSGVYSLLVDASSYNNDELTEGEKRNAFSFGYPDPNVSYKDYFQLDPMIDGATGLTRPIAANVPLVDIGGRTYYKLDIYVKNNPVNNASANTPYPISLYYAGRFVKTIYIIPLAGISSITNMGVSCIENPTNPSFDCQNDFSDSQEKYNIISQTILCIDRSYTFSVEGLYDDGRQTYADDIWITFQSDNDWCEIRDNGKYFFPTKEGKYTINMYFNAQNMAVLGLAQNSGIRGVSFPVTVYVVNPLQNASFNDNDYIDVYSRGTLYSSGEDDRPINGDFSNYEINKPDNPGDQPTNVQPNASWGMATLQFDYFSPILGAESVYSASIINFDEIIGKAAPIRILNYRFDSFGNIMVWVQGMSETKTYVTDGVEGFAAIEFQISQVIDNYYPDSDNKNYILNTLTVKLHVRVTDAIQVQGIELMGVDNDPGAISGANSILHLNVNKDSNLGQSLSPRVSPRNANNPSLGYMFTVKPVNTETDMTKWRWSDSCVWYDDSEIVEIDDYGNIISKGASAQIDDAVISLIVYAYDSMHDGYFAETSRTITINIYDPDGYVKMITGIDDFIKYFYDKVDQNGVYKGNNFGDTSDSTKYWYNCDVSQFCFRIVADIDFSNFTNNKFTPIKNFSGKLEGMSLYSVMDSFKELQFSIINFKITEQSADDGSYVYGTNTNSINYGMFYNLSGTVQDIKFTNVSVNFSGQQRGVLSTPNLNNLSQSKLTVNLGVVASNVLAGGIIKNVNVEIVNGQYNLSRHGNSKLFENLNFGAIAGVVADGASILETNQLYTSGYMEIRIPVDDEKDSSTIHISDGYGLNIGGIVGVNSGTVANNDTKAGASKILSGNVVINSHIILSIMGSSTQDNLAGMGFDRNMGGIVGKNNSSGTIKNLSSDSLLYNTLRGNTGGLVGNNEGTVESCYCNSVIYARGVIGGIVGYNKGFINTSIYDFYINNNVTDGLTNLGMNSLGISEDEKFYSGIVVFGNDKSTVMADASNDVSVTSNSMSDAPSGMTMAGSTSTWENKAWGNTSDLRYPTIIGGVVGTNDGVSHISDSFATSAFIGYSDNSINSTTAKLMTSTVFGDWTYKGDIFVNGAKNVVVGGLIGYQRNCMSGAANTNDAAIQYDYSQLIVGTSGLDYTLNGYLDETSISKIVMDGYWGSNPDPTKKIYAPIGEILIGGFAGYVGENSAATFKTANYWNMGLINFDDLTDQDAVGLTQSFTQRARFGINKSTSFSNDLNGDGGNYCQQGNGNLLNYMSLNSFNFSVNVIAKPQRIAFQFRKSYQGIYGFNAEKDDNGDPKSPLTPKVSQEVNNIYYQVDSKRMNDLGGYNYVIPADENDENLLSHSYDNITEPIYMEKYAYNDDRTSLITFDPETDFVGYQNFYMPSAALFYTSTNNARISGNYETANKYYLDEIFEPYPVTIQLTIDDKQDATFITHAFPINANGRVSYSIQKSTGIAQYGVDNFYGNPRPYIQVYGEGHFEFWATSTRAVGDMDDAVGKVRFDVIAGISKQDVSSNAPNAGGISQELNKINDKDSEFAVRKNTNFWLRGMVDDPSWQIEEKRTEYWAADGIVSPGPEKTMPSQGQISSYRVDGMGTESDPYRMLDKIDYDFTPYQTRVATVSFDSMLMFAGISNNEYFIENDYVYVLDSDHPYPYTNTDENDPYDINHNYENNKDSIDKNKSFTYVYTYRAHDLETFVTAHFVKGAQELTLKQTDNKVDSSSAAVFSGTFVTDNDLLYDAGASRIRGYRFTDGLTFNFGKKDSTLPTDKWTLFDTSNYNSTKGYYTSPNNVITTGPNQQPYIDNPYYNEDEEEGPSNPKMIPDPNYVDYSNLGGPSYGDDGTHVYLQSTFNVTNGNKSCDMQFILMASIDEQTKAYRSYTYQVLLNVNPTEFMDFGLDNYVLKVTENQPVQDFDTSKIYVPDPLEVTCDINVVPQEVQSVKYQHFAAIEHKSNSRGDVYDPHIADSSQKFVLYCDPTDPDHSGGLLKVTMNPAFAAVKGIYFYANQIHDTINNIYYNLSFTQLLRDPNTDLYYVNSDQEQTDPIAKKKYYYPCSTVNISTNAKNWDGTFYFLTMLSASQKGAEAPLEAKFDIKVEMSVYDVNSGSYKYVDSDNNKYFLQPLTIGISNHPGLSVQNAKEVQAVGTKSTFSTKLRGTGSYIDDNLIGSNHLPHYEVEVFKNGEKIDNDPLVKDWISYSTGYDPYNQNWADGAIWTIDLSDTAGDDVWGHYVGMKLMITFYYTTEEFGREYKNSLSIYVDLALFTINKFYVEGIYGDNIRLDNNSSRSMKLGVDADYYQDTYNTLYYAAKTSVDGLQSAINQSEKVLWKGYYGDHGGQLNTNKTVNMDFSGIYKEYYNDADSGTVVDGKRVLNFLLGKTPEYKFITAVPTPKQDDRECILEIDLAYDIDSYGNVVIEDSGAHLYQKQFLVSVFLQSNENNPTQIWNIHGYDSGNPRVHYFGLDDVTNPDYSGMYFILMRDIDLNQDQGQGWKPQPFVAAMLDGNNKKITMPRSYNLSGNPTDIGLFSTIGTGCVVKNLNIVTPNVIDNPKGFEVDLKSYPSSISTVNVGVLAGVNYGIVTNVAVLPDTQFITNPNLAKYYIWNPDGSNQGGVHYLADYSDLNNANTLYGTMSYGRLTVDVNNSAMTINVGGLVGINEGTASSSGQNGIITNSRVLIDIYVDYPYVNLVPGDDFSDVNIPKNVKMSVVAGFVGTNKGMIMSSYFCNASVINRCNSDAPASGSGDGYGCYTSGFVGINSGSGLIRGCYSAGNDQTLVSAPIGKDVQIFSLTGNVAGFVYNNRDSGSIIDCYVHVMLTSALMKCGFVFNNQSGVIQNCFVNNPQKNKLTSDTSSSVYYSYCPPISMGLNSGTFINNKFFQIDSLTTQDPGRWDAVVAGTGQGGVGNINTFLGFSISNTTNNMWTISSNGPRLVGADQIAVSIRERNIGAESALRDINAGVGDIEIVDYIPEYEIGTAINPVVIYDGAQFNSYIYVESGAEARFTSYANGSLTSIDYDQNQVQKNIRLVNNISLLSTNLLEGTDKTFQSIYGAMALDGEDNDSFMQDQSLPTFDGNGLSINDVSVNPSLAINSGNLDSVGLFSKIENAVIKNVSISFAHYSSDTHFSIGGDQVTYAGGLAGMAEHSKIVDVNIQSKDDGGTGWLAHIIGRNITGGLVGKAVDTHIESVFGGITVASELGTGQQMRSKLSGTDGYAIEDWAHDEKGNNKISGGGVSIAGGLIGVAADGTDIVNVGNITPIDASAGYMNNFKVTGEVVGGIVGLIDSGVVAKQIANRTSTQFTAKYYVGGLVGLNLGKIDNTAFDSFASLPSTDKNYPNHLSVNGTFNINAIANSSTGSSDSAFLVTYNGTSDYAGIYAGGVAGYNSGSITNVITNVNINDSNSKNLWATGGIVGRQKKNIGINASIKNAKVEGGTLNAGIYIGGLVGFYDGQGSLNYNNNSNNNNNGCKQYIIDDDTCYNEPDTDTIPTDNLWHDTITDKYYYKIDPLWNGDTNTFRDDNAISLLSQPDTVITPDAAYNHNSRILTNELITAHNNGLNESDENYWDAEKTQNPQTLYATNSDMWKKIPGTSSGLNDKPQNYIYTYDVDFTVTYADIGLSVNVHGRQTPTWNVGDSRVFYTYTELLKPKENPSDPDEAYEMVTYDYSSGNNTVSTAVGVPTRSQVNSGGLSIFAITDNNGYIFTYLKSQYNPSLNKYTDRSIGNILTDVNRPNVGGGYYYNGGSVNDVINNYNDIVKLRVALAPYWC